MRVKAMYGVKEADGRDSLHAHNVLSTALDPRVIQRFVYDDEFRANLCKVLDSIVVAHVPRDIALARVQESVSRQYPHESVCGLRLVWRRTSRSIARKQCL